MKNRLIDISKINCWIVNLKPTSENLETFQQKCRAKNVFGIGWCKKDFFDAFENRIYLDGNIKEEYLKASNISKQAIEDIGKINKGDIVMMRLKDGHYYIGKVSEKAFHDNELFYDESDNQIMSWVCEVEQWYHANDDVLPAEICGRFSQRHQASVTKAAPYRTKLLMIAAYEKQSGDMVLNVPKIKLRLDNFARSLNYMELEDLVSIYIYNRHRDDYYTLLPSSGKVSRIKYEFTFVSGRKGKKPITCQVKNQNSDELKLSDYENDINAYEKIYLFSGNGRIDREPEKGCIEIIGRDVLYKMLLQSEYTSFMRNKLSEYYDIDSNYDEAAVNGRERVNQIEWQLSKIGWSETKILRKNKSVKQYKKTSANRVEKEDDAPVTNWILLSHDCFFYSEDFDCFIISGGDEKSNEEILESIKDILVYSTALS